MNKWIKILSLGFSVFLIAYVGRELWKNIADFNHIYQQLSFWGWVGLALAVLGFFPNIALEAWKWKISLQIIPYSIRFTDAFAAILAGTSTGFPTPHKVGEYIGRLYALPQNLRWEALLATAMDRFCQLAITLLAGSIAWLYIRPMDFWTAGMAFIASIAWILLLLFASHVHFVSFLNRWKKTKHLSEVLSRFKPPLVTQLLMLSFARYLVFSSQYLILLYSFGNQQNIIDTLAVICIVYLGKSILPGVGLAEVGLREALAMYIMAWIGIGSVLAFQATFVLYLINSIFPALLGLYWVNQMSVNPSKD